MSLAALAFGRARVSRTSAVFRDWQGV